MSAQKNSTNYIAAVQPANNMYTGALTIILYRPSPLAPCRHQFPSRWWWCDEMISSPLHTQPAWPTKSMLFQLSLTHSVTSDLGA